MSERFDSKTEKHTGIEVGSLSDLGLGLLDSAVARPYNATIGLIAPKIDLSNEYNHQSIAARVGDFGGGLVDVVALSKVTGWGVGKGLGMGAERGLISASLAESTTLASTLSLGATGALYGGVFTPGSGTERLKNATVGLATFGTLGASTAALSKFGFLGQAGTRTFMQDVAMGGLSGVPAGIVNAEATSLVNGNGLSFNPTTVGKSALYYGLFGAAMGGAGHGLAEGAARVKSWLPENANPGGRQATFGPTRFGAPGQSEVEAAAVGQARPLATDTVRAETVEPASFNIPETGNIELGRMMRETSPADQIRLVQEVVRQRPSVPVGSWMRLIAPEDMAQFLRATDQMYPDTALRTSQYLIDTGNLRPATADSPAIDFQAWQRALDTVEAEKLAAKPPALDVVPETGRNAAPDVVQRKGGGKPSAEEVMPDLGKTAEKPFTYDDVTMSVKHPDLLRQTIDMNADGVIGTKILDFANSWATLMEQRLAAGEPLTKDMAWQANLDTGVELQGFEYETARNVLVDTWQHGAELNRVLPGIGAEVAGDATRGAIEPASLTAAQEADMNNFGSWLQTRANSRADAISMVRGMEEGNLDPVVRTAVLDHLVQSQTFLRQMGVDSAESPQSVAQSMKNVPVEEIPRFVHYADQFHSDAFPDSVMAYMDRAVANGEIPPGTQQAWVDAISAKMRIVFPYIRESEWAISSLKRR